jgi:hypothetical protein
MVWFPGMNCGHKQVLPVLFQEVEMIQTSIGVNTDSTLTAVVAGALEYKKTMV